MSTELALLTQEVTELRAMVMHEKANRLNDSLFSEALAPHYMRLASQLSKSAMVPKAYQGKPQDLFVAMAMGYQIGLSVEQAIQAIAVINGKPCLWGDDMLALCMTHPDFVDIIEEAIHLNDTPGSAIVGYRCTVKRKGKADHTKEFTLDMAKRAGLLGKQGPWTQYPERMLQMRARSFCLRDRFPDAVKGIKSREEVMDYIEGEFTEIDNKPSRTEALKRDYLTKKGTSNDDETNNNNHDPFDLDTPMENQIHTPQANENDKPSPMGETRKPEVGARASNEEVCPIAASQLEIITQLLDEKGFNEERIARALEYYEVDHILNLTSASADHFIATLHKL